MRNNNDREDDDEEYTGDSTPYYQACFVSTGSPVLSALDLLGGRTWTYMICLVGLVGNAKLNRAVGFGVVGEAVH
jgi:hypothetical protein